MSNQSSAFTLITGANSGIGLELARQAAADGRNVVLVARNESTLESAANELKQRVSVHAIAEDLSQPGAAQRVFHRVGALNINVDCLINNAGLGDYGPFFKSDLAKQESIIGVNITGANSPDSIVFTGHGGAGTWKYSECGICSGLYAGAIDERLFREQKLRARIFGSPDGGVARNWRENDCALSSSGSHKF